MQNRKLQASFCDTFVQGCNYFVFFANIFALGSLTGADQPVIKQSWPAGHVDSSCQKHHHAQILSQCSPETVASVLATVTHPHCVALRPNLVPDQSKTCTYTMIYLDHDQRVGNYSAPERGGAASWPARPLCH